jgi:Ca2+-binding RTX toxin-like protein
MEGNDIITGVDFVYGDEGNDTIDVQEGRSGDDTVNCGPGKRTRCSSMRVSIRSRAASKRTRGNRHEQVAA